MIKTDLVDRVALRAKLTRKQTTIVVNSFLSSITGSLSEGNEVEIRGFGSFRIKQREARVGLNPKTGAKVLIAAKKTPYFRTGKNLKMAVNKKRLLDQKNRVFSLQDLTQIVWVLLMIIKAKHDCYSIMSDKFSKNYSGEITVKKLNYNEKSKLSTRIAILESQLNVKNRQANYLKIRINNSLKNYQERIVK